MEETYRLKALVLHRQAYRENDLLVDLLSEEYGRIKLVARGAKKFRSKVAAHVEPFCLVEAMAIRGRREDYLGSALSAEVYGVIKSDLERLKFASEAVVMVKDLVKERTQVPEIFRSLLEYLTYLNSIELKPAKFQADLFVVRLHMDLGILNLTGLTISENCTNLIKILDRSFYQILAKKVSNRAKLAQEVAIIVGRINSM
jgi:DNA repair protein RecO